MALSLLKPSQEDIQRMIAAKVHIGRKNLDTSMKDYVYGRRQDGVHIIDLNKTWEKLILAARIIVANENMKDVCVIASSPYGQRPVIKFAQHTGSTQMPGRFTPGTFTNQIQKKFEEPRLLILTDPKADYQSLKESAYVNIPTIAFCSTDNSLKYVDVCIPANNKGKLSLGLLYWMLAREVKRMKNEIARSQDWDEPVDLFFHRDEEDLKAQQEEQEKRKLMQEQQDQGGYYQGGYDEEFAEAKVGQEYQDGRTPMDPNVAQYQQPQQQLQQNPNTAGGGYQQTGYEAPQDPHAQKDTGTSGEYPPADQSYGATGQQQQAPATGFDQQYNYSQQQPQGAYDEWSAPAQTGGYEEYPAEYGQQQAPQGQQPPQGQQQQDGYQQQYDTQQQQTGTGYDYGDAYTTPGGPYDGQQQQAPQSQQQQQQQPQQSQYQPTEMSNW